MGLRSLAHSRQTSAPFFESSAATTNPDRIENGAGFRLENELRAQLHFFP